MEDGTGYGFVLKYTLRDQVCDWVERQSNAGDYGISCAFQQRQVERLNEGWFQVDTVEMPSLLVWCDDDAAAEAFRSTFGAYVKDVIARHWDQPRVYH